MTVEANTGRNFVNHQEPISSQMAKKGMAIKIDLTTTDLSLNVKIDHRRFGP